MGTPEFAVSSLRILVENGYDIVGVITSTDKYGGRGGKQLLQSAVKKYAVDQELLVMQPKNLKSKKFNKKLQQLNADLQIVVAFRMLPEMVWNMPKYGTYNLHGSLLPKYRGAAPIHWAIINGETETGVTSFKLKHEIDTGDMLIQRKMELDEEDNVGSAHDKMKELAAAVVLESVQLIQSGNYELKAQNAEEACPAPKLFFEDCEIDFALEGNKIYNLVRGLSPFPVAWMRFQNKILKVYKASFEKMNHPELNGAVIRSKKEMKIACSDGFIYLHDVKYEGKKRMKIVDFLNGLNDNPNPRD